MTVGTGPVPRVAVVGCGYWGRNLVRNFAELGALATVCDSDAAAAAHQAEAHEVSARDWRGVLSDPAIDAISIATPAATHGALALEALAAGKHVLVEKPMALDVEMAETIVREAEARDRIVMVGHLLQYHPAFLALHEIVRDGRLGRLQYLYSNRLNFGRVRREENILWSFAPHDISMILSLVGAEPEHVSTVGHSYLQPEIVDTTMTHFQFPGGVNGHIYVSWLHPIKDQKLVVVGDAGMAVFDDTVDWDAKLMLYPHTVARDGEVPVAHRAAGEAVALTPREPLNEECRHFLECVAHRTPARTDAREGLRVLRVLRAAEQALALPSRRQTSKIPEGVMIHESAYVDADVEVGEGCRVWHFCHLLSGTRIGRNCSIGQNGMIGPDVTIGDGCKIQNNVSVYKGVTLEDHVFVGPSAVFTNVNTPRADINRMDELAPTLVGRGATIGANATIVCGTTIGAHAFVAAGAVVANGVPPHALVAGVPARQIGWVGHAGERLTDAGDGVLACPRTGRRYRVDSDGQLAEVGDGTSDT